MISDNHRDLIEGLRRWADGYSADRAAVELLITHNEWLRRPDFRRYIDPTFDANGQPLTVIEWDRVRKALKRGDLFASSSALSVLRVALSLTVGLPVDLGEALAGLDATNTAAVITALVTAAQAEDRVSITLTDRQLPHWFKKES